jgi:hypothetical protein
MTTYSFESFFHTNSATEHKILRDASGEIIGFNARFALKRYTSILATKRTTKDKNSNKVKEFLNESQIPFFEEIVEIKPNSKKLTEFVTSQNYSYLLCRFSLKSFIGSLRKFFSCSLNIQPATFPISQEVSLPAGTSSSPISRSNLTTQHSILNHNDIVNFEYEYDISQFAQVEHHMELDDIHQYFIGEDDNNDDDNVIQLSQFLSSQHQPILNNDESESESDSVSVSVFTVPSTPVSVPTTPGSVLSAQQLRSLNQLKKLHLKAADEHEKQYLSHTDQLGELFQELQQRFNPQGSYFQFLPKSFTKPARTDNSVFALFYRYHKKLNKNRKNFPDQTFFSQYDTSTLPTRVCS